MSFETESAKRHVVAVDLMEILFDDEPLRVFNGTGRLLVDDKEYLGVGDFGELGEITGGSDLEAAEVTATLSGIPSDYRSYLLNTVARGTEVNIYSAFFDEAAGDWASDIELDFAGFIGDCEQTEAIDDRGGASLSVSVTFVSAGAWARRMTVARRTDSHQRAAYPGDKFYSFLIDQRAAIPHPGNNGGGGGGGGSVRRDDRLVVINKL